MTELPWPPAFAAELRRFPAALQALLRNELAAGNEIVAAGGGFPAPPVGGMAQLKAPVSVPLEDGVVRETWPNARPEVGFTDAERRFFVMNPPLPPPPEPDMDAIRAAADRGGFTRPPPTPPTDPPTALVDRFVASMAIDYEKWHDGIGYDLDAIAAASPSDRAAIEAILRRRGGDDWRDIEALAALGTPGARDELKRAFARGDTTARIAVLHHAPDLVTEGERTRALVEALRTSQIYGGLSEALDQVAAFHPPAVIDALLAGAAERNGEAACHFAAMLYYLHGLAKTPFDWDHRPFFLRFTEDDGVARRAAFRQLCADIGVSPDPFLSRG